MALLLGPILTAPTTPAVTSIVKLYRLMAGRRLVLSFDWGQLKLLPGACFAVSPLRTERLSMRR